MTPRLLQLYAIRSQIEALILAEEASVSPVDPGCPHPEDKRRQAHNMGEDPYYLCLACGANVPGMA
jgi:hypothetical protein